MFSWEIENYLNDKNNILNEKEFIQLVDKINNPQIKDVKLSRNVFTVTTEDGYTFLVQIK